MTAGLTFNRDLLTIDGATGQVIKGAVKMRQPELSDEFTILMEWADAVRRMGVPGSTDTPQDARVAQKFGAEDWPLPFRAHVFEGERIVAVREMILAGMKPAGAPRSPSCCLFNAPISPGFRDHVRLPVTIRLLDPPLHGFCREPRRKSRRWRRPWAFRRKGSPNARPNCTN
jgi:pyruvate,orthophosphate dikinase